VTRVAAVDIGTNSTRLLVADVGDGAVRELDRRLEITRLGEGVDERRILLPHAIARVRNVLADYRRAAEEAGVTRTLAFATSAVRDAENGEAFLGEVEWSYGFETRLLSGAEEAALTLRGVGPLDPGTLVTDIGGGSTELVAPAFSRSIDIGSVRLTERFGDDLDAAAAAIRAALPPAPPGTRVLLGVDGTTAELAALRGAESLDRGEAGRELARLAALTEAERRPLLLEPDRSGVIVMGALILHELLHGLGAERVDAGRRDLLSGAVLEAAGLAVSGEGPAPAGAYTCC
jgi:exopolyphosphatase/guanosine-5'-triphosphate,3'-diphosphate pyrophosphatase